MIHPAGQIAVSSIPSNNRYYLTTFGGGSDTQSVACGGRQADGTWYYLADAFRFGCRAKIRITNPANGKSVIAQVADVGPATWVEQNAGMPVIDASPLVSQYLFGTRSSGWSDRRVVTATPVDASAPLGPEGASGASAVIAAILLAGMTAGAWWYLEKNRSRRNPTASQDYERGIETGAYLARVNSFRSVREAEKMLRDVAALDAVEITPAYRRGFMFGVRRELSIRRRAR